MIFKEHSSNDENQPSHPNIYSYTFNLRDSPNHVSCIKDRTSIRDEAALLLSISDIARTEIIECPMALKNDDSYFNSYDIPLPLTTIDSNDYCIPSSGSAFDLCVIPKCSSEDNINMIIEIPRTRTISMDSSFPHGSLELQDSPVSVRVLSTTGRNEENRINPSLNQLLGNIRRSSRLDKLVLNSAQQEKLDLDQAESSSVITSPVSGRKSILHRDHTKTRTRLQEDAPKGSCVTKIVRQKFSWKNYPVLEQFLVSNKEDYLYHSSLNYTIQQKNFNNRLTENLLDLASKHGYIFDDEFNFVTVRDRIRCYYKSIVQSAKKRGKIMGYAARKSGSSF